MIRTTIAFAGLAILSACADPLADMPRLSDVELAEGMATAASTDGSGDDSFVADAIASSNPPGGGGLFDIFRRQPGSATSGAAVADATDDATTVAEGAQDVTGAVTASASGAGVPTAVSAAAPRRGLAAIFSRAPAMPTGPDQANVAPGTALPFGQVARVCGLPSSALRTEIDRYPEDRPRFRLYDTIPNSSGQRTFYLTGFADNCPRQFTAALVTLASAGSHEFNRYRVRGDSPYTALDSAYEQIKSRVCRVARRAPCGDRITEVEKQVFFVSAYERFGSSGVWAEYMVGQSGVIAADTERR